VAPRDYLNPRQPPRHPTRPHPRPRDPQMAPPIPRLTRWRQRAGTLVSETRPRPVAMTAAHTSSPRSCAWCCPTGGWSCSRDRGIRLRTN